MGGYGVFGVELFVKYDEVWFSEVSPRPHDTGMVTMFTQNFSQFDIHARVLLGMPLPEIKINQSGASHVILAEENASGNYVIDGVDDAIRRNDVRAQNEADAAARRKAENSTQLELDLGDEDGS